MNRKTLSGLLACLFACVPPGVAAAQTLTVGATSSTSDAPIYIADKQGYFRAEGLDVKVTNFRSAADMVAPLGAGQLEAGAGSASAGLHNAVARGIAIKIVADKASSPPGYGGTKILVRKDHVDSGRYRELKDLKGMKFAMNAPGVSNTSTLNTLLKSVGLKYSDVETVDMPLPDHVAALKNKSVDASASVEPGPALAVRNGDAVVIRSDDEILPNHQIAVLLYAEEFATKRPTAARQFMRHADRHEPGRPREQIEPRLRSRLLHRAGSGQGRGQSRRRDRRLVRRGRAQGARAVSAVGRVWL